jgi:hypothetical protein
MAARGRDLERAARLLLPVDLGQVVLGFFIARRRRAGRRLGRDRLPSHEMRDNAREVSARDDLEALDQRCLSRVGRRNKDALEPVPMKPARSDEHAIDMGDGTIESELAQKRRARWGRCSENSKRHGNSDWKVQPTSLLSKLGRRKVDRQAPARKPKLAVSDRGSDAFAGFLDRSCGHAHQQERGISTTVVGLYLDAPRFEADQDA